MIARRFGLLALALLLVAPASAQNFDEVQIKTEKIAEGIYMLVGAGGNIALSVGEESTFMVDDQYAPLTDKIRAAVSAVSEIPVRFVINTHWHGDDTGGNEQLGKAGAVIPGHGALSDRAGMLAIRKMLVAIRDRIASQVETGISLENVIASKPTRAFDEDWGRGFIKPEQFAEIVYTSLAGKSVK